MKRELAWAALALGLLPVLLLGAGCTTAQTGPYVSATQLAFGALTSVLPLEIGKDGDTDLEWSVQTSQAWISLARSAASTTSVRQVGQTLSGTGPVRVLVSVDRTGLPAGDLAGTLAVTTSDGNATVAVSASVGAANAPALSVSPLTLDLGATSTSGAFSVNNAGGGTLNWTAAAAAGAPWITSVSPASGTNGANVIITIDRTGLAPGTYNGSVTVASSVGNQTVAVQMSVPTPVLSVTPSTLDFGAATTALQISIRNAGGSILNWSVAANQGWVTFGAGRTATATGTGDSLVTVNVDRTGLPEGANAANVVVTAGAQTATVAVTATVPGSVGPVASMTPSLIDLGSTGDTATLSIENLGGGLLDWSLASDQAWLLIEGPAAGPSNSATVNVRVDRDAISGAVEGTLSLTSNGGNLTTTVRAVATPVPSVTPDVLDFGKDTTSLPVTLSNAGQGLMAWTTQSSQSWLTVTPATATTPAGGTRALTIRVNRAGQTEGTHTGAVTITAENGGSITLDVTMQVNVTPTIVSLTSDLAEVAPGGAVIAQVAATDADDATLTYSWDAPDGGTITGGGESVQWTAPTTPGDYRIEVTVSDGRVSVTATLTITVYPTGTIVVPIS